MHTNRVTAARCGDRIGLHLRASMQPALVVSMAWACLSAPPLGCGLGEFGVSAGRAWLCHWVSSYWKRTGENAQATPGVGVSSCQTSSCLDA